MKEAGRYPVQASQLKTHYNLHLTEDAPGVGCFATSSTLAILAALINLHILYRVTLHVTHPIIPTTPRRATESILHTIPAPDSVVQDTNSVRLTTSGRTTMDEKLKVNYSKTCVPGVPRDYVIN